ncbi:hypothetical protein Y88_0299 [Novosphingobium nitrogenifigens DSM 19370]|uniref:Uncharacterized protein n=1 Tax=Novosphingobium nitrogenifigens DSM 19370 TaxID=983920 RepID=F1ZAX5_9SPHN|nr:hypothetical protein [Novosphingobium nitrogenifigens]EGD58247.1 hypothetical protein Y88_0299 [Novosphingobium nitrogenifigens DSM 19370]
MAKLRVEGPQASEAGRWMVRLNVKHRSGVERYGVARLTNNANGKALDVLLLGHNRVDAIFMPYDIRERLGIDKGGELDFSLRKVGLWGLLRWYVRSPDPAVFIPAWIAVIGLALAIVGLGLAALPLVCT